MPASVKKRPPTDRAPLLCRWFARLLTADSARLILAGDTLFLVIGWRRSTLGQPHYWQDEKGRVVDSFYTEEATVARGRTVAELIASARRYERLSRISMREYLRELFPGNPFLDDEPAGPARSGA